MTNFTTDSSGKLLSCISDEETVTLPEITEPVEEDFVIDDKMFDNCPNLKHLIVPESTQKYCAFGAIRYHHPSVTEFTVTCGGLTHHIRFPERLSGCKVSYCGYLTFLFGSDYVPDDADYFDISYSNEYESCGPVLGLEAFTVCAELFYGYSIVGIQTDSDWLERESRDIAEDTGGDTMGIFSMIRSDRIHDFFDCGTHKGDGFAVYSDGGMPEYSHSNNKNQGAVFVPTNEDIDYYFGGFFVIETPAVREYELQLLEVKLSLSRSEAAELKAIALLRENYARTFTEDRWIFENLLKSTVRRKHLKKKLLKDMLKAADAGDLDAVKEMLDAIPV